MNASFAKVRNNLAEMVNQVADGGQRIVLQRRGKPVAAIVSVEDAEFLERLEDEVDRRAVRKARKEKGGITLAEYRKKHKL